MICPLPWEESVPSFSTIMVGVCPPKDMALFAAQGASRKRCQAEGEEGVDECKVYRCRVDGLCERLSGVRLRN